MPRRFLIWCIAQLQFAGVGIRVQVAIMVSGFLSQTAAGEDTGAPGMLIEFR